MCPFALEESGMPVSVTDLHLAAADAGPVRLPVRLAGAQSLRQPVPRVGERPEDAERFVAERHDASGAGVAYLSLEPVTVPCDGFRDECCGRGPSRKIVRVQAGVAVANGS